MLLTATAAHAAGGHHAVDDAALLAPGQCQLETWWDRGSSGARTLLHAGPGCRAGAVELGLNLDRTQLHGAPALTVAGMQVKWARAMGAGFSTGVVLGVSGQNRAPRFLGSTVVVPVTWQAANTLLVHANLGRDLLHDQPDATRAGVALEWAPLNRWSFVAEHFEEGRARFFRTGARWALTPTTNVDLSRAQGLRSGAAAWWTLGLTWVWD